MSENGVISLDTALPTPPRTPGPSLYQDAGDTFLIAPYWADVRNGESTDIFYEVYRRNISNSYAEEIFNLVGRFITNSTGSSEAFEGSWMIAAAWSDCLPNFELDTSVVILT